MTVRFRYNAKDWTNPQISLLREFQFWVDFLLAKPLEIITGQDTFDPGTIAAGATYSRDITVTGVKAGQPVFLGLPNTSSNATAVGGANLTWVSYTRLNQLRVAVTNRAGAGYTPANITYRYYILNVFPSVATGA